MLARLAVRGAAGLLALLALGLGSGCHFLKKPKPDEAADHDIFGRAQRHWLNAAVPYDKLLVEIDAVAGSAPTDYELAALKSFLEEYTHKPGGLTIKQSDVIPQEVAATRSAEALALRYLNGPPDDGHTAFLYLLFYRSKLAGLGVKARNPHSDYFPFPGAVFIDRSYMLVLDFFYRRTTRPAFLRHEVAHSLGLAIEPGHSKSGHCTAPNCLMNPSIVFRGRRFLTLQQPWRNTELCDDCKRDLLAYTKVETSPRDERFWHGYFLHEGDGYQIVTRPGFVYIAFGAMTDLSFEEVEQTRVEVVAHDPQLSTNYAIKHFDPERDTPALTRLMATKTGSDLFLVMAEKLLKRMAEIGETDGATDHSVIRAVTSEEMMGVAKKFPDVLARFEALQKKLPASTTEPAKVVPEAPSAPAAEKK